MQPNSQGNDQVGLSNSDPEGDAHSSQDSHLVSESSKLKPYQTVTIALGLAFIVMAVLSCIELLAFTGLTDNQLRVVHWTGDLLATTASMLFIWWTMHHKERELVRLRVTVRELLFERTSEMAASQIQIQNLDALQNALVKQREDFVLALKLRLKTPIQATQTTLNHLLEGEYGELTDEQRQIVSLLVENNRDVDRLVVMLVTLYHYRNGKVELKKSKHQLATVLANTDQALMEKARQRNIAVRYECPAADADLECDSAEIQKLLNHLLENGIKYANSEVVLKCSRQTNYLQIAVEDDGCGLPQQDIETLFERFYYISQSGKYSAATGVGLCLCAEIAKAHGGTISCESTPGQGAKFKVSLPVSTKQL